MLSVLVLRYVNYLSPEQNGVCHLTKVSNPIFICSSFGWYDPVVELRIECRGYYNGSCACMESHATPSAFSYTKAFIIIDVEHAFPSIFFSFSEGSSQKMSGTS